MPAAVAERTRKDPRPRHASGQAHTHDGTPAWLKIVNKRPDRVYKLINKSGGDANMVPQYLEQGYEVEKWGAAEDKSRLRFGAGVTGQPGEEMSYRGHVLMSIGSDAAQEQELNGDGMGGRGQNYVDMVERQIRRGVGVSNPTRGRVGVVGRGGQLYLGRSLSRDGDYEEVDDITDED